MMDRWRAHNWWSFSLHLLSFMVCLQIASIWEMEAYCTLCSCTEPISKSSVEIGRIVLQSHIVRDIRATALAEYRVCKVRGIVVIFNTMGRPLSHHPSPQTWLRKKTVVWYCFAWLEHKQIAEPQMRTDGRHLSVSDGRNCAGCFQE